jgi:hypothetical protein
MWAKKSRYSWMVRPISAPTVVQQEITGGKAVISGSFSIAEAKELALRLKNGALPVPISEESSTIISPTLGTSAVQTGVKAGLIGFLRSSHYLHDRVVQTSRHHGNACTHRILGHYACDIQEPSISSNAYICRYCRIHYLGWTCGGCKRFDLRTNERRDQKWKRTWWMQ